MFVLFLGRGLVGPLSSLYEEFLGANYFIIGLLSTLASLTRVLSSYYWGKQSDHLGRRKVFLVGGLAGGSIAAGLLALAPNYLYMIPLRIVWALTETAYQTSSLALMGDLLERRRGRGRRMGVFRGVGSLGFALMAFVAGSIADRTSLRIPFFLAAGLFAVTFLLALFVRETPSAGRSQSPAGEEVLPDRIVVSERRYPSVTPLLLSAFLWSLAFNAILSVWPNYMVGHLGYTRTAMTQLWGLAALTEFPMMIIAGWLSDRVGRLPVLSASLLCWTGVFLGYAFIPTYPWILAIQVGRGFSLSAFTATAMVYATEVTSQAERGRASGLYTAALGLGAMLGGTVGGTLTQLLGFVPMILTSAALVFGGGIYLARIHLRRYVAT
jgi:MFS family permease